MSGWKQAQGVFEYDPRVQSGDGFRIAAGRRGAVIFERQEPFGRFYVVADESGRATIATYEFDRATGERVTDLEAVVRDWLDDESQHFFALLCGIDPGATLHTNRGPREEWTDERLAQLVDLVVERQERGEAKPTDLTGVQPFFLSDGRIREVLKTEAEPRGLVKIEAQPGQRNRYVRATPEPSVQRARESEPDALRTKRVLLDQKRQELEAGGRN